jgi:hypothetical protein
MHGNVEKEESPAAKTAAATRKHRRYDYRRAFSCNAAVFAAGSLQRLTTLWVWERTLVIELIETSDSSSPAGQVKWKLAVLTPGKTNAYKAY